MPPLKKLICLPSKKKNSSLRQLLRTITSDATRGKDKPKDVGSKEHIVHENMLRFKSTLRDQTGRQCRENFHNKEDYCIFFTRIKKETIHREQ